MFKIEYETPTQTRWLNTEYSDPDDADRVARNLVRAANGEIVRTTVVEQAGFVYSEWRRGSDEKIRGYLA